MRGGVQLVDGAGDRQGCNLQGAVVAVALGGADAADQPAVTGEGGGGVGDDVDVTASVDRQGQDTTEAAAAGAEVDLIERQGWRGGW